MSIRALIVDDEYDMRQLLCTVLHELGVESIHQAADAEQAKLMYEREQIDLVFLDLHMPGENGFSVLTTIQQINADAYVVIVSAANKIEHVRQAIALGAKGFVVKPYKVAKIKDVVDNFKRVVNSSE